ncbi:hypothetical protein IWW37_004662 [Coemansia sp. RSA 2050]|nr:hypothetical protein IWW37_004662 [Coemansia sp. RSA 2050]KAJ2735545.1 hypothetical protein IW152_001466 [Coemansia sp. BCRC 34962]
MFDPCNPDEKPVLFVSGSEWENDAPPVTTESKLMPFDSKVTLFDLCIKGGHIRAEDGCNIQFTSRSGKWLEKGNTIESLITNNQLDLAYSPQFECTVYLVCFESTSS